MQTIEQNSNPLNLAFYKKIIESSKIQTAFNLQTFRKDPAGNFFDIAYF